MPTKPTISQVAHRAKVATSTVSRVLNGGYASASVRARVEKVIRDLGYTPSTTARNLKMGRTGIIGVVVETSQGSWFTQLLGGIEAELAEKRVSVVLASLVAYDHYDASAVEAWISEHRVDGIIFAPGGRRERPLVRAAQNAGLPLAFVAPDENFKVGAVVRARNRDAGHLVADHLFELGHRRISFIGGPSASVDTKDRLRGLQDGLLEHSIKLRATAIHFAANYRPESAEPFAQKWLKMPRDKAPTAVVLGNDSLALAFMRHVQQQGVRIPDDVSVVGFDGVPEAGLSWPGLTTVEQPTRSMGSSACKALLRQLQSPNLSRQSHLELPMRLLVRESTGPAPGSRTARKRTSTRPAAKSRAANGRAPESGALTSKSAKGHQRKSKVASSSTARAPRKHKNSASATKSRATQRGRQTR